MTDLTDLDDRALALVLDGEPAPAGDPALAAAVERARRDVDRIRRGIRLVGEGEAVAPRPRQRWLVPAAAAAALVAAIGGLALMAGDDASSPASVTTTTAGPPIVASGRPGPALTLDERVAQADRIVVGTIAAIDRGVVAELPYVLATVDVDESIKGDGDDRVVAFDYDLGGAITSSETPSAPWTVGDRVLLFLVSDAGTVSEDLEPAHLQVADGPGGRFLVVDGAIDAPFTLDEVRQAAG